MRQQIKTAVSEAISKLYPEHSGIEFSVDYAPDNIGADFACNVAMVLGKQVGEKPMEVAERLREVIPDLIGEPAPDPVGGIGGLDSRIRGNDIFIVPPGFLNFQLPAAMWHEELVLVLNEGQDFGGSRIGLGKKARVEYVSANPTGPIHIGNARGGPYGEVICKILEKTGYTVMREYFHNDIGGQVEKLGQTIWYWYQNLAGETAEFPEGGYQGEYLKEVALLARKQLGSDLTSDDVPELTAFALDFIYRENMALLNDLGIKFDSVVKESELKSSGRTAAAVGEIKAKGLAKEKDGALWFAPASRSVGLGGPSDEFLADREAVIVKSDGNFTYFASDIAYHKEKFTNSYDLVIDILGSNHHGHVPKLQALAKIYGFNSANFHVLLYQYVRVKKGSEILKMSKRAGTYVTAREVLDEVGKDSMIFMLLMTAVNTHVDFDLELAKDTSEKNPVYKVQYAHARINSIIRKSKLQNPNYKTSDLKILQDSLEIGLIRELSKFPDLIHEMFRSYNVHHLPHYLLGLAERFHSFYEKVRVISDDEKTTQVRLSLIRGVQIVLANGLRLMGINPLDKM